MGSKNSEKMILNNDHKLITPLLNNLDNTDTAFKIGIQQHDAIFALMGVMIRPDLNTSTWRHRTTEFIQYASGQRQANEGSGGLNLNCRSQSTPYGDVKKTIVGSGRRRRRQD
ncbi:hypothetical protein PV326_008986 [Microctonus aethiopoides]|nr:hypothetical protein PV326_008986 [Microctonus aethiopoides]